MKIHDWLFLVRRNEEEKSYTNNVVSVTAIYIPAIFLK